jgi:Conjugal transfer protein TrbL
MDLSWLKALYDELSRIEGYLYTLVHPNLILAQVLKDTVGLVLDVWYRFILSTTDFETGHDFVTSATINRFEPAMQLAANGAMVLIAVWASYRMMWGQSVASHYTARAVLPRLFAAAVLINFAMPLFQMGVSLANALSATVQGFVVHDDLATFLASYRYDASAGTWEIITTAVLAAGYGLLAIAYLVRYAVLIVLAITAPLAALLYTLPETEHLAKTWVSHFTTNLFMQPAQLFVLAVGLALEHDGFTPVHHLFALASLLIALKVPGALGGAEKSAHKLQSTAHAAFTQLARAAARA